MRITLNGEPHEAPDNATIIELLESRGLSNAVCAVEVNRALSPRREHAERRLAEGDSVEIVTLVGGG